MNMFDLERFVCPGCGGSNFSVNARFYCVRTLVYKNGRLAEYVDDNQDTTILFLACECGDEFTRNDVERILNKEVSQRD